MAPDRGGLRTKRGDDDTDSAWLSHVGFVAVAHPRSVLGRIRALRDFFDRL